MHILVTGGTGFIGHPLCVLLLTKGHDLTLLSRRPDQVRALFGNRVTCIDTLNALPDASRIDAIINLAGAPIIGLPWTAGRRNSILQSRIGTTDAIVALIARLDTKPHTLISGSAIGYYGIGAHEVTENATPTAIFQSQLCAAWEAAALKAELHGVRVCLLRTGVVLGRGGGALPQFALPVKLFAGTVLGPGTQWISWIHLDDMLGLILFALDNPIVRGPLNCTAPNPVTHRSFMRTLATVLQRPLWLWMPAFVLRLGLGEMAQLLVDGQKVAPAKAIEAGYQFHFAALEPALRDLC